MATAAKKMYSPRAQRFPMHLPLHYQRSGSPHWHDGRTVNISRTGILFQTDEELQQNAALEILVDLPTNVKLSCQGSVVRSEPSAFAVRIRHSQLRCA